MFSGGMERNELTWELVTNHQVMYCCEIIQIPHFTFQIDIVDKLRSQNEY